MRKKGALKVNLKNKIQEKTSCFKSLQSQNNGDLWIVLFTVMLVVFGTVMILFLYLLDNIYD